jgi:phosphoribosyl 1,2-cyclic phosphate phosphodiesterase
MIGCDCKVCTSSDPRDQRTRCSIFVEFGGRVVLIDTTPDFRFQALRSKMPRLDAILFTHQHADHIMGLDDVRPFNFRQGGHIPVYGDQETSASIARIFPYVLSQANTLSSRPKLDLHEFSGRESISIQGLDFLPIALHHGEGTTWGFRFGKAAYLTDHNVIPEESLALLQGLDVLFLDALRHKPHPTHSHLSQSLKYVEKLKPNRAFFTHICHDLQHVGTESLLPAHVRLAFDGLQIQVSA